MNRSRVTGDLTASGLLYADIANDRVGIGSTIPGNKLSLPDSAKIGLGNAEDLTLHHDGTHSYITNTTGDLRIVDTTGMLIRSNSLDLRNGAGDENYITCVANGAVSLYHNNVKKLETTSSGVTLIDGLILDNATNAGKDIQWQPANDRLAFFDNTKATFGDGADLALYHDGSNSYVAETGTGDLVLQGGTVWLQHGNGENALKATQDAGVELRYNNVKKVETTSYGLRLVDNYVEAVNSSTSTPVLRLGDTGVANYDFTFPDNATIKLSTNTTSTKQFELRNAGSGHFDLLLADNGRAKFGDSNDLQIFHNGSHNHISATTAGQDLKIINNGNLLVETSAGDNVIRGIKDGAVELYYDNSKKLHTRTDGIEVTGVVSASDHIYLPDDKKLRLGNAPDLEIYHAAGAASHINATGLLNIDATTGVRLEHNNSTKLETTSSGIDVTGTITLDAVAGANTSADLKVLFQTAAGTIDGGSGLTYNPANDILTVNGADISANTFRGSGGEARLSNDNYSSTDYVKVTDKVELFDGGSVKIATTSSGVTVTGGVRINDANTVLSEGSSNSLKITTDSGFVNIGPMNTSWCHFDTDRTSFYFAQNVSWNGNILPYGDSTHNLGSNGSRWANIYGDTLYGDGANVSNVNATTLDSIDSGSFLRSDANDTMSGVLSLTNGGTYPLTINGSDNGKIVLAGASSPYIRFREGSTDKAYIQWGNDGYFYIVNQEEGDYLMVGGGASGLKWHRDGALTTVWTSGNDGSGSGLDADTLDGRDSSSSSTANTVALRDGNGDLNARYFSSTASSARYYFNNSIYLSNVTTQYGSVQVNGSGVNGWEGYSIDGRVAFMHDGSTECGIYDDVNNQWMFRGFFAGATEMMHNSTWRIQTDASGFQCNGRGTFSGTSTFANVQFNNNSTNTNKGYFTTSTSAQTSSNCPELAGSPGNLSYGFIYQEASSTSGGGWSHPYPDLVVGYHTGVRIGGHYGYNGIRFYNDHPSRTTSKLFSMGEGDTNNRSYAHLFPSSNNTYDLGSNALRWRNIYTNDLNLSNEGDSNDVDGTWGNYTIQEGEDDLFLINRRSGKKYKFNLTEVS